MLSAPRPPGTAFQSLSVLKSNVRNFSILAVLLPSMFLFVKVRNGRENGQRKDVLGEHGC